MNQNPQPWIFRALKPATAILTAREIRETGPTAEAPSTTAVRDNLRALARTGLVESIKGTGPRGADCWRLTPKGRNALPWRLR